MTMSRRLPVLALGLLPAVLTAQSVVPNDPWFPAQASLHAGPGTTVIPRRSTGPRADTVTVAPGVTPDLPGAWALTTGSRQVVVALLDDGFFYRHEDLAGNIWQNPGESGLDGAGFPRSANGVDDDGNGYVDDAMGWDFVFDDPDPDHYVFDGMDRSRVQPYRHSITALGIVGARGNNGVGIAGINWDVSMMLLKIGAQGTRRDDVDTARVGRAARAIRYAVDNGARVINWSGFVQTRDSLALAPLRDAVRYAAERSVLVVTGAGNDGLDLDDDRNCMFPQCFDFPNQVRVAEVDFAGELFRYEIQGQIRGSNFGRRRVELGAIGGNFTTDLRNGESTYGLGGGTSDAGPVVAGIAALLLSVRPDLTAEQLRAVLLASATPLPQLAGRTVSGGVVNARRALERALELPAGTRPGRGGALLAKNFTSR